MPLPTKMSDLSTNETLNSPLGADPIGTGLDNYLRSIQAIIRTTNAKGSDIASASTTDIGAATGEFVTVTGTTTITSFGTIDAGIVRDVHFSGALTITHNATSLILPGVANFLTQAGDVLRFRSLGSGNWRCVGFVRSSGIGLNAPIVVATVAAMKALTGLADGALVQPLGYHVAGDFQMKPRRFVVTGSPPTDNGGTVIRDNAGIGYFSLSSPIINFREFGARGDGVIDDTSIFSTLSSALTPGVTIVFGKETFKKNGCFTVTASDVTFVFLGTKFLEGDTGANGTIVNGSSGKIGWLFKQSTNLSVLGSAYFYGQGTIGATPLLCVAFDNCVNTLCSADMYFNKAAIGRMLIDCTNSKFGDIHAEFMDGLQTFENPPTNNAGSAEVVIGCSYINSGNAYSFNGEKPCRYMSVGTGLNNIACNFGASVHEHDGASASGHALTLRSAVSCNFGPAISKGGAYSAINIQIYAGDQAAGYLVDDVFVESVQGDTGPTGASVDSLVYAESLDTNMSGSVRIGEIKGSCSGEFGIFNTGSKLSAGHCSITGSATRLIAVYAGSAGFEPSLHVDHLEIKGNSGAAEPISIGKGGRITANYIDFLTGPTAAVAAAIFYNSGLGVGALHNGVSLGSIRYRQNGSANNYAYIVNLSGTTLKDSAIWSVDADGVSTAPVSVGVDFFKVRNGQWFSDTIPNQTGVQVGTTIWKSNVADAGSPGWVYSSSNTWRTMAAIS